MHATSPQDIHVRNVGSVGSHRDLRGPYKARIAVYGDSARLPFSRLARSPPVLCTSPGLLWIGPIRPSYPSPPLLSFLLPLSNYLLVSSPAGRSFFEKTTRARTRPTHSHKNSRSLPHPNRRYSSTFVCIFPSPGPHTRSPSANAISFLLFSNSRPYPLHVPNPTFSCHINPCLHISRVSASSIRLDLNLYLTSHSFSLISLLTPFLPLLTLYS